MDDTELKLLLQLFNRILDGLNLLGAKVGAFEAVILQDEHVRRAYQEQFELLKTVKSAQLAELDFSELERKLREN